MLHVRFDCHGNSDEMMKRSETDFFIGFDTSFHFGSKDIIEDTSSLSNCGAFRLIGPDQSTSLRFSILSKNIVVRRI